MPRISRGLSANSVYHILNRGNGKQKIFHKEHDYKAFIDLMIYAKKRNPIKIFAYCLMPNHFHLIVMPKKSEELSKFMQWLMTSHVRRYHNHYETSGHVWQGRYKSFMIQKDNYLLTAIRYVEGNPVRAGLVRTARDWVWSSHKETISDRYKLLIDNAPVELVENWTRYVDETWVDHDLKKIRESVNRQSPYGDKRWQKINAEKYNLMSTIRSRGRPRK